MEQRADVVIVGGGISGCAIAYNLAKRGARVVVLEKGEIASEGSGKTMAAVGLLGKHRPEMPMAMTAMRIWEHLSEELACETDFVVGGRLSVAEREEDLSELERAVKEAKEFGLNAKMITPAEARGIMPALEGRIRGAAYSPNEGHADPLKTTLGFANAAREHGAKIYTHCYAMEIGLEGGRVGSVMTPLGEIKTPVVVNAAGIWGPRLAKSVGVHIPIKIIRYTVTETAPLPPLTKTYVRGPFTSCRQTASGNLRLGGGYRVVVDHEIDLGDLQDLGFWLPRLIRFRKQLNLRLDWDHLYRDIKRILPFVKNKHFYKYPMGPEPRANRRTVKINVEALFRLIPSLQGTGVSRDWGGLMDMTPDHVPVLGEVGRPKGLILATGFSGHGFALGPITGKLISEIILDGKPSLPLDVFRHSRFAEGKVEMPGKLI